MIVRKSFYNMLHSLSYDLLEFTSSSLPRQDRSQLLFVPKKNSQAPVNSIKFFEDALRTGYAISKERGVPLFFSVPIFECFPILWHDAAIAARLFSMAIMTTMESPVQSVSYILDDRLFSSMKVDNLRRLNRYVEFCEHLVDLVSGRFDQDCSRIFIHPHSLLDKDTGAIVDSALVNRITLIAQKPHIGVWHKEDNKPLLLALRKGISYEKALQKIEMSQ